MKALMYLGCAIRFVISMVSATLLFTGLTLVLSFLVSKRVIKIILKKDHKYDKVSDFFKDKLPLISEYTDKILFGFKEFIEV